MSILSVEGIDKPETAETVETASSRNASAAMPSLRPGRALLV